MKLKPFSEKKLDRWVAEGRRFYCFGAGKKLNKLCREIRGFEKKIAFIADGNPKLQGKVFETDSRNIIIHSSSDFKLEEGETDKDVIVLLTSSFFREIVDILEELPDGKKISIAYYYPQNNEVLYNHLFWFFSRLKPQKKIIFRSGNATYVQGWDFNDNAKALYDYMLDEGYNKRWKLIWLVKYPNDYPELKRIKNVKAISYDLENKGNVFSRFFFFYHICTAKYLFFTDAMYWTRFCNKNQVRVNLWHGNGYKLKKSKDGKPLDSFFDFTTVSGPTYIPIHADMFGCSPDKILTTGYPKDDLFFDPPKDSLDKILDIHKAEKYVFWLPTFRSTISGLKRLDEYKLDSETGMPILSTMEQTEELNSYLSSLNIFLIIKIHYAQRIADIELLDMSNIKVLTQEDIEKSGYQINSLLALSDAMISDFSSVAVDYMLMDKPMAFTLDDEDLYQESRGFAFDDLHAVLPGSEIYNLNDMKNFFNTVANGGDPAKEKRHGLMSSMHFHQDGRNRERLLDEIGLGEDSI